MSNLVVEGDFLQTAQDGEPTYFENLGYLDMAVLMRMNHDALTHESKHATEEVFSDLLVMQLDLCEEMKRRGFLRPSQSNQ